MKILITGDFCPINRLDNISGTNDIVEELLADFTNLLNDADIAITNLECPLSLQSLKPLPKTGPNLIGNPSALDFLKTAGFNLITLANNHILDYGAAGLKDTIHHLEERALDYCGAGKNEQAASKVKFIKGNGITVAFVCIAENEWASAKLEEAGANGLDPVKNYELIVSARSQADFVFVISHGGHEHYSLPSPRMKRLFRFFIDIGADAVINHHPHCISGYEEYKGNPIYYSLGNFLFDAQDKRHTIWNTGMAVQLTVDKNGLEHTFFTYEQCNEMATLRLHDAQEQLQVSDKIDRFNQIIQDDDRLKESFEAYVLKMSRLYKIYVEPFSNRYLRLLQSMGLMPYLLRPKKKRLLLNLSRCESHRDILHEILERQ